MFPMLMTIIATYTVVRLVESIARSDHYMKGGGAIAYRIFAALGIVVILFTWFMSMSAAVDLERSLTRPVAAVISR